ncbi:DUF6794 domain-containing protein [Winogradskyella sediminis]|uniref:DUF6794 domain-containing protein n=1 Tax=Winogradskyella sediminis TaxID=1382466 RepID=UPI000E223D03|nr:DUF6794 domain-containing protein [Winogradskyella sediminis]REG83475.1 hypothetical protein C8N41_1121 [Winogradskyella sediminis]
MKRILAITFLLLICQYSFGQIECQKYIQDYIPIDLNDAINYFECKTPKEVLTEFAKKNEDENGIVSVSFGTGMSIRNNWGLWARTSKISEYFSELGIHHPDDMSSIILTSLHRKLNGTYIDLENQVKFYKEYWAESERKETERKKQEFSKYKIGDLVEFSYDYDFVSKRQEKKWMDDKCYATAIIKDLNPEEFELKVKLKKSCDRKGIVILKYDVYDKVDGEFQKIEKDKTEIMKKGETRWSFYNLWSIVEK